jgi:hypothetical protein
MERRDGEALTFSAEQRARALGLSCDQGLEMVAQSLKGSSGIEIRRLDFETEGQKVIDLNIACDQDLCWLSLAQLLTPIMVRVSTLLKQV